MYGLKFARLENILLEKLFSLMPYIVLQFFID